MTHEELVDLAVKWLKIKAGCSVAYKEVKFITIFGEIPDAIGFKSGKNMKQYTITNESKN